MNEPNDQEEWPPRMGPDSLPIDFSREEAAYQKVREQMVREHLGKIALVHKDEVIGAFDTADEALLEGYRRFGMVKMMFREIRDPDGPDFISLVDVNHPSFRKLN